MTIPALPLFRHRDTVVTPADQNQFVTQFENTMDTMSNDVIPALNLSINDMNTQYNNIYNNLPFAPDSGYSQAYIDSNFVKLTENQTIEDVKTFSSSPIVPTPTTNTQAANKQYVDSTIIDLDQIGLIDYGYVAKPYHVIAFGGEFNRADYPKLWAYLEANPSLVKTQAQWTSEATANGGICGFFSDGDGTTTFRVPNLDKAFLRPDSRSVASYQGDDFKAHTHETSLNGTLGTSTGGGGGSFLASGTNNYGSNIAINALSAGGVESRPKNVAVLPLIVAK